MSADRGRPLPIIDELATGSSPSTASVRTGSTSERYEADSTLEAAAYQNVRIPSTLARRVVAGQLPAALVAVVS
jgi:hypothetical protein